MFEFVSSYLQPKEEAQAPDVSINMYTICTSSYEQNVKKEHTEVLQYQTQVMNLTNVANCIGSLRTGAVSLVDNVTVMSSCGMPAAKLASPSYAIRYCGDNV